MKFLGPLHIYIKIIVFSKISGLASKTVREMEENITQIGYLRAPKYEDVTLSAVEFIDYI